MDTPYCPITGKEMKFVFSELVLNKYKVNYYYCEESGILKTEKPYWLEEAYKHAISQLDTGLVSRNLSNSSRLIYILEWLSITNGKLLDVSGGYGLLTRLLRDKGFDCYSIDAYCQNLFARAFEPDVGFQADALFAFEVLEHIDDPFQFIDGIFKKYSCKTLIFSTLTFENQVPSNDWWYYVFETGQHITFYQQRTFSVLAKRLNCNYYMITPELHIISDKKIPHFTKSLFKSKLFKSIYSFIVNQKRKGLSYTWKDHLKMKELNNILE